MSQQAPMIFNGRYELHRRLGRGGMAEVYLARDQMLDRPVAVKVLFPALATDPGFVERFRREAQSAAALNHPNIVGVYDWGEANGTYFIVMEYVEGESLAELIHAEGRLHPDRAAEIGADIASALGFAHRNGGVIHRDVKPGNVLITREGDVKVADFGIARAMSESSDQNLTKTGSVMGTATYFSPEQARGAGIDPRSDVYSLGCVMYEMIVGHPPFAGENAVAIAYKHVQEVPTPLRQIDPAVPDTLEAIILKCLAKNPDNRYPSAQDLRADLKRYLDGARIMAEPVMAPPDPGATGLMAPTGYMQPTSTIGQADPWAQPYDDYGDADYGDEAEEKRSKAPLIILLLLLLLLAGLLIWWALSSRGGGSTEVEVPEVIGQTREEATTALEDDGFEVEVRNESDPDSLPGEEPEVGTVVAQDPRAGATAEEGETVTITVWQGEDTVAVPDVAGQPEDQARATLEQAGFSVEVGDPEASDEVEEGNVIRTDPQANEQVAENSLVRLIISSGPEAVTVPSVVGQTQDQATATIEGAGLTVGGVTQEPSNEVQAGYVIRSDPDSGAEVPPESAVTLVVSSGAENVAVPEVLNRTEANARQIIEQANLVPQVQYEPVTDPQQNNRVISQSPSAGSSLPPGESVILTVGQFDPNSTTTTTFPDITLPGGGDGD